MRRFTPSKNTIIKIVNVLGQCIQQLTTSNQQLTIDMSGESKGIYFIQVQTAKGVENRKVVVE